MGGLLDGGKDGASNGNVGNFLKREEKVGQPRKKALGRKA